MSDNRTNDNAVVILLSDVLRIAKSRLRLSRGLKSKDKTVILDEVKEESVTSILDMLHKASAS
jgi:uncharacterized protein YggU (UPF0235/DUF167 family)